MVLRRNAISAFNAPGEIGLEVGFGLQALDGPGAVPLAVLERLQLGDDRSVGAEAVLDGVEAGSRLAAGRAKSSLRHRYQIMSATEEKASGECHSVSERVT